MARGGLEMAREDFVFDLHSRGLTRGTRRGAGTQVARRDFLVIFLV